MLFRSYVSSQGCRVYHPRMIGWGGNIVALLPHGASGIRLAKSAGNADNSDVDTTGMARAADRLVKFCDNVTLRPAAQKMRNSP